MDRPLPDDELPGHRSSFRWDPKSDYYKILGVLRTSSPADLSTACYALARTCHPELAGDPRLVEKFQSVSEAYEVLSDAPKRCEYDRQLDRTRRIANRQPTGSVITADLPVTLRSQSDLGAFCLERGGLPRWIWVDVRSTGCFVIPQK